MHVLIYSGFFWDSTLGECECVKVHSNKYPSEQVLWHQQQSPVH